MDKFNLVRTDSGLQLRVRRRGPSILRFPLLNKGTGFTAEERARFGLEGLLPSQHNDIETQAQRIYQSIEREPDDFSKHIGLAALQDRNEHLFYRVLHDNLEEYMPIVYTPTVGQATQNFSKVFRRARGIWITPDNRGRIAEILRRGAPYEGVELMVVTDNESILGIGDQGAGGMAISVGKLALYIVGAGIHPAKTLPISLDVGTNNQELLEDPLYLGWPHERLKGEAYTSLIDEFVEAAKEVFPGVTIQWEDFRKDKALAILDRYRDTVTSFNDDIQGTGAVALAAILAGCRVLKQPLKDQRILIYGAGAAGLGIARQLREGLQRQGLEGEDLLKAIILMDSRGMLTDGRGPMDEYKKELVWPESLAAKLDLPEAARMHLPSVIEAYRPTVLVGASGKPNAFDKAVVGAMIKHCERPMILPLSNPTSSSEAAPADLFQWTNGSVLIATGSPYKDVVWQGKKVRIGQANNVFIFPGLGLGAIVAGATRVTDAMISAAAMALADFLTDANIEEGVLMPRIGKLWDVTGRVGLAVARQAIEDGVATKVTESELEEAFDQYRWFPAYPEFVKDE